MVGRFEHRIGYDLLRGPVKAPQNFHRFGHGLWSKKPGTKRTLSEARDLAVLVHGAQAAAAEPRNLQPHRIRSDVNRSERGHGGSALSLQPWPWLVISGIVGDGDADAEARYA